ncbi:hypothetical protein HPB48_001330 [Haemaphysalis longicornis]|uniref:Uncharacterized protein n=1 Tax=Haemaphysalis longicornis TaxID=44386 RepID=A0A9J6GM13_HAELO|nr:hypothetical protein HPB48_001330 [Haemaphysalis longicornis]
MGTKSRQRQKGRSISTCQEFLKKTGAGIVQAYRNEVRIGDAPGGQPARATTEDRSIVAAAIREPFAVDASDSPVRRSAALRSAIAAQKALLSASNKEARLRFAISLQWWAVEDRGVVVFSADRTQRQKGALTAGKYCHIMETVILQYTSGAFPNGDCLFQQGLSPVHTARSEQANIQQTGIDQLAVVPKEADSNIIENVWRRTKVALNRTRMPSAYEDGLWAAVLAERQRLASETSIVTALYESLPSSMSADIEVNSDMAHY